MRTFTRKEQIFFTILSGFGYQAIIGGAYLTKTYYALFKDGMGINDAQMSSLMAILGMTAIIGYGLGGFLADIFSPSKLMIISYIADACLLLWMATLPGYQVMKWIHLLLGIFSIMTFWSAAAKFIESLGSKNEEGKLYGRHFMFVGISASITGFGVSAIIARSSITDGLRSILCIYAVTLLLVALLQGIFYKEPEKKPCRKENLFQFAHIKIIARNLNFWLVCIMCVSGYMVTVVLGYYSMLLTDSFAIFGAAMMILSTIKSQVSRMVVAPISGFFVDRIGSPTKIMLFALGFMFTATMILVVIPWKPSYTAAGIILMMVIAVAYNISTPCWFTPLSEIGIDFNMKGTAVGLLTMVMNSPDFWGYALGGYLATKMGMEGIRILYTICAGAFLIGILDVLVLRKRLLSSSVYPAKGYKTSL